MELTHKIKDHESNSSRRPLVSGVQSGVAKSKGNMNLCDGAYL